MPDTPAPAKVPHIVVTSPCGRVWHLPVQKVREDYARFLVDVDGPTFAQAMKKSTAKFAETWFAEQYLWTEVERDGVLVKGADEQQIKTALDFYRSEVGISPTNNAKVKRRG